MNKNTFMKYESVQQGFTLIEVLVALLILSVGMLGAAGMQTHSLQSGGLATERLTVLMKAQEIAERIRINATTDVAAAHNITASYSTASGAMGVNHNCGNGSTLCTPTQMAEYDVYLWKQDLLSILPNDASTTASIVVDNPAGLATVTITISWKSPAGTQISTSILQVDTTGVVQGG